MTVILQCSKVFAESQRNLPSAITGQTAENLAGILWWVAGLQRRLMYSLSRSLVKIRPRYGKNWDSWVNNLRILTPYLPSPSIALPDGRNSPLHITRGISLSRGGCLAQWWSSQGPPLTPYCLWASTKNQGPAEPGKRNVNPALGRNAYIAKEL